VIITAFIDTKFSTDSYEILILFANSESDLNFA
jgi:hypothetical protein